MPRPLRAALAAVSTAATLTAATLTAQCPTPVGNAALSVVGEARPGNVQQVVLTGRPSAPFAITVDTSRGPIALPWGTVCQGPGLAVLFGGNTGAAGDFRAGLPLPTEAAWIGTTLWFQGFVADPSAPNGALAISASAARTLLGPSQWVWPGGPSTSEDFFPLGVWLQSTSRAQKYADDLLINTYVGLGSGPTEQKMFEVKQAGMHAYAIQNTIALESTLSPTIHAWRQQDEPDNAQPNPAGGYFPCVDPAEIQQLYQGWKAVDPRPVFLNFGQGATYISYPGRGSCTGQTWMYPEYIKGGDIISFDIYPATTSRTAVQGRLEYVAYGLQNLRGWIDDSNSGPKVLMNFIGTTNISSSTLSTSPEQIKSMVWMSLIHGSQGILYFVHEFWPSFREDGIYNHPANVDAVRATNALITALAPVLNAPTQPGGVQVATAGQIATMVKHRDGKIYVFACEMTGARGVVADFTIPGVADATVVDLEEGRRAVPFAAGTFRDTFGAEGYDAHVYEITPR